jgi:hypothetical protein
MKHVLVSAQQCQSIGFITNLKGMYQDMHLVEHPIGRNEIMGDAHSVRFHGMTGPICENAH